MYTQISYGSIWHSDVTIHVHTLKFHIHKNLEILQAHVVFDNCQGHYAIDN